MQKDEEINIDDILKSLDTDINETDLDHVYVYIHSIMDKLTDEQIAVLALAFEKLDKDFNDYEED